MRAVAGGVSARADARPLRSAAGAEERATRLELALSAGVVFAVALLVRLWAASQITFPAPEDTAYYVGLARNLLEGRGLVSDALWTYGTEPLVYPRPAFEVWLPLPTFLAVLPMAVLGATFAAAQWSSVLVGAAVPVLAWRLAADLAAERGLPRGRARSLAIGTGLASAVYLPLVLHSALPDSTMLFGALALGAGLLMSRLVRAARERPSDRLATRPLVALGALIGLAALTRNEAAWIGLAWLALAWRLPLPRSDRVRIVVVPGLVAAAIVAPWAARNWLTFGTPLPGQALSNALSLDGRDIFAWQDQPTLARYLAAGPGVWIGTRVAGAWHNLFNVLVALGVPTSMIGLVALPWIARRRSVLPIAWIAGLTFVTTTLLFPVTTTWGTFLHAAVPAHVLLVLGCLDALDALIVRVGAWRGWSKPVAWLGPALAITAGVLFTGVHTPNFGAEGRLTGAKFAVLRDVLPVFQPAGPAGGPVITDFPIWLAEETGYRALALPNEPPESVLDLARHFPGATLLVVDRGTDAGLWPGVLDQRATGSTCFERLEIPTPADPYLRQAIEATQMYRVGCR
jgi:hypothetical protein